MKKRTLIEELNIMLANAFREKELSLFEGRPDRDTVIGEDDIVNLRILLNTASDMRDFLRQV